MSATIWQILALEPTKDQSEIRRAYARKLKLTNPEDDAAGFQNLRAAYNAAMAWAMRAPPPEPAPPIAAEVLPEVAPIAHTQPLPPNPVAEHDAACNRLAALITAPEPPTTGQIQNALREIFAQPLFEHLGVAARTENYLAGLLATYIPRTDEILAPAIAEFHWNSNRIGQAQPPPINQILARQRDLDFRQKVLQSGAARAKAFTLLAGSPAQMPIWASVIETPLYAEMRALLKEIEFQHPSLLGRDNLKQWQRYFGRPHTPVSICATIPLWPLLAVPIRILAGDNAMTLTGALITYLIWLIPSAALTLAPAYVIAWPRLIYRRRIASTPFLLRLGWLPFSLCLMVAAALLPPNGSSAIVVGVLAAASVCWSLITGERQYVSGDLPVPVRLALRDAPLLIFWLMFAQLSMPADRLAEMSISLAGAMIAGIAGISSPLTVWKNNWTPSRKRIAVGALMAATCIAAGLLVLCEQGAPKFRPLALASIAMVELLRRVPAAENYARIANIRRVLVIVVWFGGVLLVENGTLDLFAVAGASLLVTAAVTIFAFFVPPVPEARRVRS